MKKKQFGLVIPVMIVTIIMGLSLAACGDKPTTTPPPSDVKSEQVTDAAAWKAAFDFSGTSNVTLETTDIDAGDGATGTIETIYRFVGDKIYLKQTETIIGTEDEDGQETQEVYYSNESDAVYQIQYDDTDKKWYKSETDVDYWPTIVNVLDDMFNECKDGFADFRFDAEKDAYTATDAEWTYAVKIVNGKVSVFTATHGSEEEKTEKTVYIHDIGTTSVTLPSATVKQGA